MLRDFEHLVRLVCLREFELHDFVPRSDVIVTAEAIHDVGRRRYSIKGARVFARGVGPQLWLKARADVKNRKRAHIAFLLGATHIDMSDWISALLEIAAAHDAIELKLIRRGKHAFERLRVSAREAIVELEHRNALDVGWRRIGFGEIHARVDVKLEHEIRDRSHGNDLGFEDLYWRDGCDHHWRWFFRAAQCEGNRHR